jgi:hypothetical protein
MAGHFDIAEAEIAIAANQDAMFARAMEVAPDEAARRFVALQFDLRAIQREALLWAMRSINGQADFELMANALGRTLGNVIRDFCRTASQPDAVMALVFAVIGDSLEAAANRDRGIARDDIVTSEVEIKSQPGGHA